MGGGGKGAPAAPAAPDPAATAQAQAAANKEASIAQANINMVNQYTPQGSLEYSQRGTASDGTPQYSATQTLSPDQQALYDLTNQAAQKYGQTANTQLDAVSNKLSQPLDFSSLGGVPQANQQALTDSYNSIIQRNQPQADRQLSTLQTSLANQGIGVGSQAYSSAMDDYNRSQNDFNLGAQGQAIGQMGQLYGLQSSAYNQGANAIVQQRSEPLNELAAMLTGSQVQNPTYVNAPQQQVQPADVMGATYASYNGAQNTANIQNQAKNASNQGLYGLLGSGAMAGAYAF